MAGMRCIHSGQNAGALGRELVSWGPWSIWPSPGQPCREMRHPVVNPVEPWASTPRNTIPCGQFRRALGTAKASQSANLLGKMLLGIQNAILYAVLRRCRSFSRAIAAQTSNGLTNHRPPLGTQCPQLLSNDQQASLSRNARPEQATIDQGGPSAPRIAFEKWLRLGPTVRIGIVSVVILVFRTDKRIARLRTLLPPHLREPLVIGHDVSVDPRFHIHPLVAQERGDTPSEPRRPPLMSDRRVSPPPSDYSMPSASRICVA